jgi:hypothetical protein
MIERCFEPSWLGWLDCWKFQEKELVCRMLTWPDFYGSGHGILTMEDDGLRVFRILTGLALFR